MENEYITIFVQTYPLEKKKSRKIILSRAPQKLWPALVSASPNIGKTVSSVVNEY